MRMDSVIKDWMIIGISTLFIGLACLRSLTYMYNSQELPFRQTIFPLRFSPTFHPFTKIGDFENTKGSTNVYLETKKEGFIVQDIVALENKLGGPHVVRVSIIASTTYIPRREAFNNKEAAYSLIRFLFCKNNPNAENVYIQSRNDRDTLTSTYVISCSETT